MQAQTPTPANLPVEILSIIVSHINNQHDLQSVMLSNKRFYGVAAAKLYSSITIDSNFNTFDKEFSYSIDEYGYTTYIMSAKRILKWFKSLQGHKDHLIFTKKVQIVKVPDEFIEFNRYFMKLLKELEVLNTLDLSNISLSMDVLENLTCLDTLSDLRVNFISKKSQFILPPHLGNEFRNSIHLHDRIESKSNKYYPLKTLSIENFTEFSQIFSVLNKFHINPFTLKHLKLSAKHSETHNNNGSLINQIDFSYRDLGINVNSLDSFCLSNCDVTNSSDLFLHMDNLKHLELINLSSRSNEETSGTGTISTFPQGNFPRLESLKVGVSHNECFSFAYFFKDLTAPLLKNLDITMKYPLSTFDTDVDIMVGELTQTLSKYHNQLVTLCFDFVSTTESTSNLTHFHQLGDLSFLNLENLSLSVLMYRFFFSKDIPGHIGFPKLQKFWLKGESSIPKHWGLGTAFPGVYDDWLRVQSIPKSWLEIHFEEQTAIKYIKVYKYLFEVVEKIDAEGSRKRDLEPTKTIDYWFDRHMGVDFGSI